MSQLKMITRYPASAIVFSMCGLMVGNLFADHRDQFLEFASTATDEYRSANNSGSYEVLILRKAYNRIEKVRFHNGEFAVEMVNYATVLSEQNCISHWQETGKMPNESTAARIGATGETTGYRYSLQFAENRSDLSEISRMEVFSGDKRANTLVASIFYPFTIGNCGFAVDAVRNGELQVVEWRLDQNSKMWYGRFKQQTEPFEFDAYFDPVHRGITKLTFFYNKEAASTMEFDYRDKLSGIRVYRHLDQTSTELAEKWFFSSLTLDNVDPRTFRISNFGHKEPILPDQIESPWLGFVGWSILPILGIAIIVLSRWMTANKGQ
ncbi:MAG: hypothetical protein Q8M16_09020 [Pirellulaceae bacterium]|nr:hypothetical protein [Pirellulaceae bacterium]